MLLEKDLVYSFNTYLISTYFAFSPHILELFLCLSSIVLVTSHCRAQLQRIQSFSFSGPLVTLLEIKSVRLLEHKSQSQARCIWRGKFHMPAAPRAAELPPAVPRMCLANERGSDVACLLRR